MKNCPVCRVDFDDSFSFCEFDGAPLEKVLLADADNGARFAYKLAVRGAGIVVIAITIFLIVGLGSRKLAPPPAAVAQTAFIETPQAAQDYPASQEESAEAAEEQKNNTPKRPGVEIIDVPEKDDAKATDNKNTRDAKAANADADRDARAANKNAKDAKDGKASKDAAGKERSPLPARPNAVKTPSGERTTIAPRDAKPAPPAAKPDAAARQSAPPVSAADAAPAGNSRAADNNAPLPQPANAGSVSLHLVRIRSHRTAAGIRYELTFHMRENGGGRLIRWERLSLVSRSASGITHAEAVPFHQRLGNSGSLTFTVAKEMRGNSTADWQGQISCTGIGTDISGNPVRSSFTTRVTP